MKRLAILLLLVVGPEICRAGAYVQTEKMPVVSVLRAVGNMIDGGYVDGAAEILNNLPNFEEPALDIERMFLLGRLASARQEYNKAILIFRHILDEYPDLARVRFELALCYMQTKQWHRADYQLRRAMAGKDLPDNVKTIMNNARYVIRQNKNWNLYFNMGLTPDSNINTAAGGEECIKTMFGTLCRKLPEPQRALGLNTIVGGDYEFILTDNWRWKTDAHVYADVYNKHDFDNLYLSVGMGPRYIWERGDVWLSVLGGRRWYGWNVYNWSGGGRLNVSYDFARNLSGRVELRVLENIYDEFENIFNGYTYDVNTGFIYSFNASKYVTLNCGLARETTKNNIYSHWRPSAGVGFGTELLGGFTIFLSSSVYWQRYDEQRWVISNNKFEHIAESSFTNRYAVSVSNNKLSVFDFVPTLTVSYTRRHSNIWQREYDKIGVELGVQQRF